jgi:hypothetical protein
MILILAYVPETKAGTARTKKILESAKGQY